MLHESGELYWALSASMALVFQKFEIVVICIMGRLILRTLARRKSMNTIFIFSASSFSRCSFNMKAMERALYERLNSISDVVARPYRLNQPVILYYSDQFSGSKAVVQAECSLAKLIPCATSEFVV